MARHAPSCTGVGAPKVFTNQSRLGAEKRLIGMPEVCHPAPTDHGTRPEAGWAGLLALRAGRVETMVALSGFWLPGAGGGFDSDRSFLAARLNQLQKRGVPRAGSTSFVGVEVG